MIKFIFILLTSCAFSAPFKYHLTKDFENMHKTDKPTLKQLKCRLALNKGALYQIKHLPTKNLHDYNLRFAKYEQKIYENCGRYIDIRND